MHMKKAVLYLVVGAVGLGAGIGTGYIVNKPKLEQSQAALGELQAKMEEAEKTATETLQKAGADKTRLESEIRRINTELIRYRTEYVRADAELRKLKESIIPQDQVDALSQQITQIAASQTGSTAAQPAVATGGGAAAAPAKPVVAAGEYVIKDGDNLWKIAAEQLGSGIRYKEILAVNPGIKENSTLAVGSKIKLPAR
jgi:nucleoid-associated protein YgaU